MERKTPPRTRPSWWRCFRCSCQPSLCGVHLLLDARRVDSAGATAIPSLWFNLCPGEPVCHGGALFCRCQKAKQNVLRADQSAGIDRVGGLEQEGPVDRAPGAGQADADRAVRWLGHDCHGTAALLCLDVGDQHILARHGRETRASLRTGATGTPSVRADPERSIQQALSARTSCPPLSSPYLATASTGATGLRLRSLKRWIRRPGYRHTIAAAGQRLHRARTRHRGGSSEAALEK